MDYSGGELGIEMVLGIADIARVAFEGRRANTGPVVGAIKAVGLVASMVVDILDVESRIADIAPVEFEGILAV